MADAGTTEEDAAAPTPFGAQRGPILCVLGPVGAFDAEGKPVLLPSPSQRRLLAALAAFGRGVHRDVLAEVLEVSPGALRKLVSRVRLLVGDAAVETDPIGYRLGIPTDAERFVELTDRAPAAADPVDALRQALALWQGPALEEFEHEPWAVAEVTRLAELRDLAVAELAERLIDAGRGGEAVAVLEPHVRVRPLVDQARGLLVRALASVGRQAEALRAYQDYRTHLAEEVGTEPSAATRDIDRRVAMGWNGRNAATGGAGGAGAGDGARSGAPAERWTTGSVPRPSTAWIGSRDRLDHLAQRVAAAQLVTLTGPGGIGKTRSAVEVALLVRSRFRDGVWMVELAAVDQGDDVVPAVAAALGVQARQGLSVSAAVIEWLAHRQALVVLDNAEHVVADVARLVGAVLAQSSTVTFLCTSRERLGLEREQAVAVDVLALDDGVELFCQRARAVAPDLAITVDDTVVVATICDRLDRLPLAIELAAARARSMGFAELRDRLDDRFAILARRQPLGGQEHHRTLRATVDWSYELLAEAEQRLFASLSVFPGSFDLTAVEAVCDAPTQRDESIAELLGELIERSMVTVQRDGGRVRYRLLETLRHYGAERLHELGDHDLLAMRHARHYLDVAERTERQWFSSQQLDADDAYDHEWDNLRAAVTAATHAQECELGARLIASTLAHAHHRMRSEHGTWAEAVVACADRTGARPARALGIAGWWAMLSGDHPKAAARCRAGIGALGGGAATGATGGADGAAAAAGAAEGGRADGGVALCRGVLAFSTWSAGDRTGALGEVDAIRSALDELEPWDEYNARRAIFSYSAGADYRSHADRIASIAESFGSPSMVASARFYQGVACTVADPPQLDRAAAMHAEGIALAQRAKADLPESQNRLGLHTVTLQLGAANALEISYEAMVRLYDLRYWLYLWPVIDGATQLLAPRDPEAAARVLGHLRAHVSPWYRERRAGTVDALAGLAGVEEWYRRGAAMPRDAVVAAAIEAVGRLLA